MIEATGTGVRHITACEDCLARFFICKQIRDKTSPLGADAASFWKTKIKKEKVFVVGSLSGCKNTEEQSSEDYCWRRFAVFYMFLQNFAI